MPGKDSISEKNVGEEFFLTPAQLSVGVAAGKLNFQERTFHGMYDVLIFMLFIVQVYIYIINMLLV